METKEITLGGEVYVTDPCYEVSTWCQLKLDNVLPGKWLAMTIYDESNNSGRNAELLLIHKDHINKNLRYDLIGDFGVDSGQAGVFDVNSYRDDSIVENINSPNIEFSIFGKKEPGDTWYESITKFTLADDGWGSYDTGVVSRTGWGDGVYPLYGAKVDGKIVSLHMVFIDQSSDSEYEED